MGRLLQGLAGIVAIATATGHAFANDGLGSELSHAAGGAAVAGAATYLADSRWPADRGWIGFAAGTGVGILGETFDLAKGGKFSLLDVASDTLGAALGAVITDGYILRPVVATDQEQHAYFGVKGRFQF
jgi:hypothetical protein